MAKAAAGSSAFMSPPGARGEETMARLVIRGSGGRVNEGSGFDPARLGACRSNALARAMRRVQLQGGAREPHARRTLCTLSVRPRVPTPQMGPYHRSRRDIMLSRAMPLVILLLAVAPAARAAEPLVVSVWGGNWKDTIERVVAKPFTAKTGIPVEFEVGGTIDRLAQAARAKGSPLVGMTLSTDH